MVEWILEQQQAISAVLAEDRKFWHLMPIDAHISVSVLCSLYYLTKF